MFFISVHMRACAHTHAQSMFPIGEFSFLTHPRCVQHYTKGGCLLANLLLTLHIYVQASHERCLLMYDLQKVIGSHRYLIIVYIYVNWLVIGYIQRNATGQ